MVFFEKKNQKTFANLRVRQSQRAGHYSKAFCFFFSKKQSFPTSV
jgi:hypothetical protein